jgi:predicted DCC family thiol-disulfide oxidoreductase YuxK
VRVAASGVFATSDRAMSHPRATQAWVLWDGTCGFCSRVVAWVKRQDRHDRLFVTPFQRAPSPPMTEDLLRRCEHAIVVIRPDAAILSAGQGSLYIMDAIGWRHLSALFSRPPLIWLVEAVYWFVARHRHVFSRLLFSREGGIACATGLPPAPSVAADSSVHPREGAGTSSAEEIRLHRVKLAVCVALAAGVLLSPKLWISSRSYPLVPVWASLPALPFPLDYVVFGALLAALAAAAVAHRPGPALAGLLLIAGSLSVLDQTRWQPWLYQYVFMLGALALFYRGRTRGISGMAALNICCVIVGSTYLWSGLHKLNRDFLTAGFPWFLQTLYPIPAQAFRYVTWLGVGAALLEASIGIALMTVRWRRPAVIMAIMMHVFILATVGPTGHNVSKVVLPWNLAMMAFVILLFWNTRLRGREIFSPRQGGYHLTVVTLFAVLPVLSFVHLWDSYLSFAVYASDAKNAQVYLTPNVREHLPPEVRAYVAQDEHGRTLLDIWRWAATEVKVPPYPETRSFRRLGMYACRYAAAPTDVELVIEQRSLAALWTSLVHRRLEPTFRRTDRYDCTSLHQEPDLALARKGTL